MKEESLTLLEKQVLKMLLSGDLPLLVTLQEQLELCEVERREYSGTGFFTYLNLKSYNKEIKEVNLKFGDVIADIDGLRYGAGFLVYVEDGILSMLEGYSFEEAWPIYIEKFTLKYVNGESRDWDALKDTLGYID